MLKVVHDAAEPTVNDTVAGGSLLDEMVREGARQMLAAALQAEVLPLLYLHGLSSSDFTPAFEQFLGTGHGLSAATISRLTRRWQDDARAFAGRSLYGTVRAVGFFLTTRSWVPDRRHVLHLGLRRPADQAVRVAPPSMR